MRACTISQLSAETPENVLILLWPGICEAADMPLSMHPMPPVESVRALWPFIVKAVPFAGKPDMQKKFECRMAQLSALQNEASSWPMTLYELLPASHQADDKGK